MMDTVKDMALVVGIIFVAAALCVLMRIGMEALQ